MTSNPVNSPTKTRVFLVDDHPVVRRGLAQIINQESDLHVCGEAVERAEAFDRIRELRPDLAVIDLSLQNSDGLELIKDLKLVLPDLPILVLSMHDELICAERSLRAGARGYIMKQEAPAKVIDAIRHVLTGNVFVSDAIRQRLLHIATDASPNDPVARVGRLSDRELQVYQLLGASRTTREIATHLNLSVKTVETHYKRIKDKLSLNNFTELVQSAALWAAGNQR